MGPLAVGPGVVTAGIDVYVFALLTAVLWGLTGVVLKLGLEDGGGPSLATVVVVAVSFTVFLVASVVRGGPFFFRGVTGSTMAVFAAAGVLGSGFGRMASFAGVDRVGASVNTAVINTRPLFAAIMAVTLLGEPITGRLAAGIGLITLGVVTLSLSRGGDISGWAPVELLIPIAGAVLYAVGNVVRRVGFLGSGVDPVTAIVFNELGALCTLGAFFAVKSDPGMFEASRRTLGWFVLGGLTSGGGLIALFYALSIGPVVVVDPLSATPPLFAIVFTALLLGGIERVTKGLVVGAVLVVAGIALITLSGAGL